MLAAVFLISLAMVAMGVASTVFGAEIIQVERGMTMVIAGAVVATGGAVLFGLGVATQRLRRIERELVKARERTGRPADEAGSVPAQPALDGEVEPPPASVRLRPTLPAEAVQDVSPPPPAADRPAATVVGRYASGGNSYVMYSDGSIDAETPSGPRRFGSIDELKLFAAGRR